MSRPKKPAALKQGKSETKAELKIREEKEKQLMGSDSDLKNVPNHLNPRAKAYYKFLIAELEISGLLTNLDKPILEQTADALSKMRECDDILNAEGVRIWEDKGDFQVMKEHPTVKTKATYLNAFKTLSSQLGMSPSSRAQLAGMQIDKKKEENNPLMQLLSGN